MTSRRKKRKTTIYLDPDVEKTLADFAARRDRSQSMIAEAAIASFLSPDDAERREAIVAKRLDQLDRRMKRVERDVGIAVESLVVFIRFWLATTPALPEPAAQGARAKAGAGAETPSGDLGGCARIGSLRSSRAASGLASATSVALDRTTSKRPAMIPHPGTASQVFLASAVR